MNAILFESNWTVVIGLAIVLIVLLVASWQTRKRSLLVAAGVVLAVLGLYLLLDFAVETDPEADRRQLRERIVRMAEAVGQRNVERLFEHISDNFKSPQGKDRRATLAFAQQMITSGTVTEIRVWDIGFEKPPSREKGEATVRFLFKPTGNLGAEPAFPCEATYEWKPPSGWMLKGVVIYDPVRTAEPFRPLF